MRLVFREYELYAVEGATLGITADIPVDPIKGRRLVYTDTLQI
jgi:hypothetical protein